MQTELDNMESSKQLIKTMTKFEEKMLNIFIK